MTVYIKTDRVFEGEDEYLTAGKEYEVIREWRKGRLVTFDIIDDDGENISTLQVGSAHLPDGAVWERIER